MSEPIRSASASPFAAARPQVHSRRVSLRVGAFGLTYTTDRLLWEAPATPPTASDPTPVDPAPAIEAERQQPRSETTTFPADLETARRLGLWATAQDQAARQQTLAGQVGGQVGGQGISGEGAAAQGARQGAGQASGGLASGSGPVAESQARPGEAQSGEAQSGAGQSDAVLAGQGQAEQLAAALSGSGPAGAQAGGAGSQASRSRGGRALAQALRHATQAYQACQAGFACPRPMLQAVA